MKRSSDQGLTLLEVALALTIFLIGIGFILKSDAVTHKYLYRSQLRQQMTFYAAGLLEAQIEGVRPTVTDKPFSDFQADYIVTPEENPHLEKIEIRVYLRNSPTSPEPVSLFTYRVKNDE
jgi:prepilin-type N-terminal cleavage/methylation domain-containing protein